MVVIRHKEGRGAVAARRAVMRHNQVASIGGRESPRISGRGRMRREST